VRQCAQVPFADQFLETLGIAALVAVELVDRFADEMQVLAEHRFLGDVDAVDVPRHGKRQQQGDDRQHDEQFDQREPAPDQARPAAEDGGRESVLRRWLPDPHHLR
jgi:hypothetical protein